ncbi:MAG: TIGR04283 family arsenosugar biosynthesis glycosyltransferase [Gammaproteobacteria bacterium]|nr:TIGR04283 family arsenosugar biosynthesis glycosyltransferase [Gammaproteobacteria bacterium]
MQVRFLPGLRVPLGALFGSDTTLEAAVPRQASLDSVTAVVPVLDDAEHLARLLEQLASWPGLEVVVVDGGSRDDPFAVCRRFGVRCLASAPSRGGQLRRGVEAAGGEWLWLLHADAEVTEDLADALAEAMRTASWGRFDVRLSGASLLLGTIAFLMNWRSAVTGICTGDHGIFVSRALLDTVGGVPDQPLLEDVELSKRLRRRARPFRVRARLGSSGRRWERAGVLRTVVFMWWLRLRYFLGARPVDHYRRYYRAREAPERSRVAVFARAPERGRVKTRLVPALGLDGAYDAHVELAETTLAAVAKGDFDAELWYAGVRNAGLVAWGERFGLRLVEQPDADLGERMLAALRAGARVVVGTDIPRMSAEYIEDALRRLDHADVVLGPVEDGGYCLIAMDAPHASLFRGIEWGGADVLERTLAWAVDAGLRVELLDTLWDVDDAEDHARWREWRGA